MPRSLRIQFAGAYYHVMVRGNRRETVFHDDDDRRSFLATLAETCAMTGWRVHAWVLMAADAHSHRRPLTVRSRVAGDGLGV